MIYKLQQILGIFQAHKQPSNQVSRISKLPALPFLNQQNKPILGESNDSISSTAEFDVGPILWDIFAHSSILPHLLVNHPGK